jgi:hypothetical protein
VGWTITSTLHAELMARYGAVTLLPGSIIPTTTDTTIEKEQKTSAAEAAVQCFLLPGTHVQGLIMSSDDDNDNGASGAAAVCGIRYTASKAEGGEEALQQQPQQQPRELRADCVVLATGGYAASRELLNEECSELVTRNVPTTNGAFATGDGIVMARSAAHAATLDMDCVQVHPTGFVDPKAPHGASKILAGECLRGEGGILLNAAGKRFVNELETRDIVSAAMHAQPEQRFWLVLTSTAAARCASHVAFYSSRGLQQRVASRAALSKHIGVAVDAAALSFADDDEKDAAAAKAYLVGSVVPCIH